MVTCAGIWRRNILDLKVSDIMTEGPVTTTPETMAAEVINQMNDAKIGAIFVTEHGKPVGIAHLHDFPACRNFS